MADSVIVERRGGVTAITLNRPECLNALDLELVTGLKRELQRAAGDRDVTGVVIAGTGKAFCAGGDLVWASQYPAGVPQALHVLAGEFHQAILEVREMNKPVIAAIGGVAAGGGFSLALACDFRVLHRAATLRQAYTSAGLSMDGGSSYTLPRLIGEARALEVAAFDAPIPADRALAIGLATEVTDGDVVAAATTMAETLSQRALASFSATKRLFAASFHSPLEAQLSRERQAIVACAAGAEGREGVTAFLEKRRPVFSAARSRTMP